MRNKILTEREWRTKFASLSIDDFEGAMQIAKNATFSHSGFQHYTTLPNLHKMLTGRSIWLSRLDSKSLNDQNESGKYGAMSGWRHSYVGCFSYGKAECAAMWKMYCRPNPNAVRLLIAPSGMKAWNEQLSKRLDVYARLILTNNKRPVVSKRRIRIKFGGITDVVYAAVKKFKEDKERSNDLYWNGEHLKMDDLFDLIKAKNVEGFFKDYEWRYERETRLFVIVSRTKEHAERLSINIPGEVFQNMSVVLSPWLPDDKVTETINRVRKWFNEQGMKIPTIRRSYLTGALSARCWK